MRSILADPVASFALNVSVTAVISVLVSWIVARIYFRKRTPAELIGEQIRRGLQSALMPTLYPQFYDEASSIVIHPQQPAPANKDVPHVDYARLSPRLIRPGAKLDVLMKVLDLGYDLVNPGGIHVRDHRGRKLAVVGVGLGFCKFSVLVAEAEEGGAAEITIDLTDLGSHTKGKPNSNVQSLPFIVEGAGL
jgi:hypothetical protein